MTILAIYLSILFSHPEKNNLVITVTNFVIVIYCVTRAFLFQKYNYSIYQFFYIFSLLFMGLAPLVQYKQSIQTVVGYDITDNTYIITNVILIAIFIIIDIIYGTYQPRKKLKPPSKFQKSNTTKYLMKDTFILRLALLVLSSISLVYALYINQQDLTGLFYRDTFIDRVVIEDNMIRILTGIIRPLAIFAFIFYFAIGKSKSFKTVLFLIAMLSCFPLSLSRFLIGAYWIPVLITIFQSLSMKKTLGYVYTLGLLILFPMLEVFRAFSVYVERGDLMSTFLEKTTVAFSSITYDTYQSLAFVIQSNFITSGQQLLGVLGLFIPRSMWEEKPVGSGFTVSNHYGLGFDNISMNFFGEGYINFGIAGIFLFAIFLAIAIRFLDREYWSIKSHRGLQLFPIIYLIVLGIFAYLMRGDMLGSFTSTIGAIISVTLVYFVICVIKKSTWVKK
jgi:oligosaccharide repeat unit polymerase